MLIERAIISIIVSATASTITAVPFGVILIFVTLGSLVIPRSVR